MGEIYIGIENEFVTFEGNKSVHFRNHFSKIVSLEDYFRSNNSIRTTDGNGFYVDGSEIEILTPPIAINKGFATRLTDSLMIGRDKLVNSTPGLKHTGYSMHWNMTDPQNGVHLSDRNNLSDEPFFKGIAVPFHLFGLTPLSVGSKLRHKGSTRYELLGDSLTNEDQIKATSLLLGAYNKAKSLNYSPFIMPQRNVNLQGLFLPDGRYNKIPVICRTNSENKKINIQSQQYLELFYHWIKPFVSELGTNEEIKNLEGFISGDKKLEFDKFKYFAHLQGENGKKGSTYHPIKSLDKEEPSKVLRPSNKKRELPLEAKLLGEVVKQQRNNIDQFNWESLSFHNRTPVYGIKDIYNYANSLNPELPSYVPSNYFEINPNKLEKVVESPRISYDESKDNFKSNQKTSTFHHVKNRIKEIGIGDILASSFLVAFASFFIGASISELFYDSHKENASFNKIVEKYEPTKLEENKK